MTVVNVLIGVAVLVFVVVNQMRTKPIQTKRVRVAGILALVGLFQLSGSLSAHPVPALGWALLLTGLAIGAGIGVWRAYTMAVWSEDGRAMVRGTWFTAGLWVLGMAVHVGIDLLTRAFTPAAEAVGSTSILLFVAVSLGAQGLALLQRARVEVPQAVLVAR